MIKVVVMFCVTKDVGYTNGFKVCFNVDGGNSHGDDGFSGCYSSYDDNGEYVNGDDGGGEGDGSNGFNDVTVKVLVMLVVVALVVEELVAEVAVLFFNTFFLN